MRIGINLLYLLAGIVGGTETYAAGLLVGLATVAHDNEFIVFVNRESSEWPLPSRANFTRVVCPVNGTNRAERYYFEQVKLPKLLRRWQVDLCHSLGYVGPVTCPCPAVLTIPDPNYIDIAHTIPLHRRLPLRLLSTQAGRNADKIVTISEFSKQRLQQALKFPADKIAVTHLAPRPEITLASTASWPDLRIRYQIEEPYIVAFGGGALHKNIPALLHAFAQLDANLPHHLVLIGHIPPNVDMAAIVQPSAAARRVITTGYIPGEHIAPLLSHADLFVLPSLYEGFGLPVLEAQQAGVAVACSTAGSLPEIAGDGALLFDPNSVADIASKITECLANPKLRRRLREQGRANLTRFSWEKTATETLRVYTMVLAGRSNLVRTAAIL
jgi:glycosyltransferase involved in cell wall biosynthesis